MGRTTAPGHAVKMAHANRFPEHSAKNWQFTKT